MTENIIIILSISTIWIFDSVRVIQLDSRWSSQRVNTLLLPPPISSPSSTPSSQCFSFCSLLLPLQVSRVIVGRLSVSLSLPLALSHSFIFRYTTHTKDEEMKRPRPGDEMFGPWKEMEFWLVDLLGKEDVAFDWFFFLPFYAIYVRWTIETGDKEENLKSSDRAVWKWRSQLEWQLLQRLAIVVISQFDFYPIQSRYYKPSTIFSFLWYGLGGSLSVTLRLIK